MKEKKHFESPILLVDVSRDCKFKLSNSYAVLRKSSNFIQEVEAASAQMGRNDPSFASILLPSSASMNGNFISKP